MIKKLFKFLFRFTSELLKTIVSIGSIIFFSSFSSLKRLNKNSLHKEERECFVIGNGPSFKKILDDDYKMFLNKEIFVVNLFYLNEYFEKIKPNNYVITDNGFWEDTKDQRILEIQKSFMSDMKLVYWEVNLFVTSDVPREFYNSLVLNKKLNVIKYNRTPVEGLKFLSHIFYKYNLGMPRPENVIVAAIFIAINSGNSKINVYGIDFSSVETFFIDKNNNICVRPKHFYDKNKEDIRLIHLKKSAFKTALSSMASALDSYEKLNEYAIKRNVTIINKTNPSYVEAFKKE
jgi:hypothetical protein